MRTPAVSKKHLKFVYHALLAMNAQWIAYGRQVELFYAEAIDVFGDLEQKFQINYVFS